MTEIWTTGLGEKKKFTEIDQQHLSNILWFNEFFCNRNRYNDTVIFELGLELHRRFDKGNLDSKLEPVSPRLPWKPLPIPNEIRDLKLAGAIDSDGNIIGNRWNLLFEGKIIGSINHIENWKSI